MAGYRVGTWLSLVERTLGVGEVASSNLVVPTIFFYSKLPAVCMALLFSVIPEGKLRFGPSAQL